MELRHGPCPRCGCVERVEVDDTHVECAECGLGATVGRIILESTLGAAPDPEHLQFLDDQRRMARLALEDLPFEPFALDDRWMGPRSFGGHGRGGNGRYSVTLTHGEPLAERGPLIRVETERSGAFPPTELSRLLQARSLVSQLWHHTGVLRDDVRRAAFPGEVIRDTTAPWEHKTMPIDGAPNPTDVLTEGDHWVALTTVDDLVVSLTARSWPFELTGLERQRDLAAYDLPF